MRESRMAKRKLRAVPLTARVSGAIVTGSILALMRLLAMFQGESWDGWRAILKAIVGVPLSDAELDFYRRVALAADYADACVVESPSAGTIEGDRRSKT
jgi:hypothetical protein